MGNFFPRWSNWLPLQIALAVVFIASGVTLGITYYFTPKYYKVGYQPTQPVPFSHKQHVGEVGLDCRYCHSFVEVSSASNVPTNQTCYNCHGPDKGQIKKESPKLQLVRDADKSGQPIQWVKVHKVPDFAYFNHSVHLARGVSCQNCHGQINEMPVVFQDQPQSMGWCLDCHRNPENKLRPLNQVTNLTYKPSDLNREEFYANLAARGASVESMAKVIKKDKNTDDLPKDVKGLVELASKTFGDKVTQQEVGPQLKAQWHIEPPESCAGCHR
jgi:hypothetical protein